MKIDEYLSCDYQGDGSGIGDSRGSVANRRLPSCVKALLADPPRPESQRAFTRWLAMMDNADLAFFADLEAVTGIPYAVQCLLDKMRPAAALSNVPARDLLP